MQLVKATAHFLATTQTNTNNCMHPLCKCHRSGGRTEHHSTQALGRGRTGSQLVNQFECLTAFCESNWNVCDQRSGILPVKQKQQLKKKMYCGAVMVSASTADPQTGNGSLSLCYFNNWNESRNHSQWKVTTSAVCISTCNCAIITDMVMTCAM